METVTDGVSEKLLADLRKLAPHKVRVFDSNEETRDIAVPHGRKRWSKVLETIEARPWVRVEMLNKEGAVLGYVETQEATDLEDLGRDQQRVSERWFLEMMIKAQKTALEYRDKEHSHLLEAMTQMIAVNAQATRELVELFRVQRDVSADIAAMKAAAENGGDLDQIAKMVEKSPQLIQALAPIFRLLTAKQANGRPPKPEVKS